MVEGTTPRYSGQCVPTPFHDAHPVTYLLQPSLYKSETMRVKILATTPGNPEHGLSLVDRRDGALRAARSQPPGYMECDATVLTGVDAAGFLELVTRQFEELGNGASRATRRDDGDRET